MSISSLADDEILRTDRARLNLHRIIEPKLNEMLANFNIAAANAPQLRTALHPMAAEPPMERTKSSTALDALVKYIPTESVTLSVAASAAITSLTTAMPWLTAARLYWGFVAFTPVLYLLIYIGKRRSQNLRFLPEFFAQWPWWKLFAATVAFAFWALAIPPLLSTPAGQVSSAFGALLVSTILTLLAGVFEPKGAERRVRFNMPSS